MGRSSHLGSQYHLAEQLHGGSQIPSQPSTIIAGTMPKASELRRIFGFSGMRQRDDDMALSFRFQHGA